MVQIRRALVTVTVSCLFLSGCGKSPQDEATEKITRMLDDISNAVNSVHDDTSCKEGITKVQTATREFQDLAEEIKGLTGEPSPKGKEKLNKSLAAVRHSALSIGEMRSVSPAMKKRLRAALEHFAKTVREVELAESRHLRR